jgi:DNA-binding transcriptional ArsR family regulator
MMPISAIAPAKEVTMSAAERSPAETRGNFMGGLVDEPADGAVTPIYAYLRMFLGSFFVEDAVKRRYFSGMPSQDCTDILKALSDRSRMRLVKVLLAQGHGVNDLAETLKLSQYNVSKHLRILRQAGIVDMKPEGTRREYFIATPFRERLQKEGSTLDFGCCSFRFDQLPD